MAKQQPELSLREQLEILDTYDRRLIGVPKSDPSGQKARSRRLRAFNALAIHYFEPANTPQWAKLAFAEAEAFFAWSKAEGRPAPEGIDELVAKVNSGFDKLRVKTAFDLKSYRNTFVRDARVNFLINGELLRKRVREVIDPSAPQADVELAAWGARTLTPNDGSRDWVVMTMPIPDEIWSNEKADASGFKPWDYEPMQVAIQRECLTAYATITAAEQCYEKGMAQLVVVDQSRGLT